MHSYSACSLATIADGVVLFLTRLLMVAFAGACWCSLAFGLGQGVSQALLILCIWTARHCLLCHLPGQWCSPNMAMLSTK